MNETEINAKPHKIMKTWTITVTLLDIKAENEEEAIQEGLHQVGLVDSIKAEEIKNAVFTGEGFAERDAKQDYSPLEKYVRLLPLPAREYAKAFIACETKKALELAEKNKFTYRQIDQINRMIFKLEEKEHTRNTVKEVA